MDTPGKLKDLSAYKLLIVGSKECPLNKLFPTLAGCWQIPDLARVWKGLGARLGLMPNTILEMDKESCRTKKWIPTSEVITKWRDVKRAEGHEEEANLMILIEVINKLGFHYIAERIRTNFKDEAKAKSKPVIFNKIPSQSKDIDKSKQKKELKRTLKRSHMEDTTQNKKTNWTTVGNIRYQESKPIRIRLNAQIYQGKFNYDYQQKNVAVKRIPCENKSEDEIQHMIKEAEMLLIPPTLQHESLLQYYGVERAGKCIYLALDMYHGTLRQVVEKQIQRLKLNRINSFGVLQQITEGIAFLHKNKIVHGDLKPGNVLVIIDDIAIRVKIADVGKEYANFKRQFPVSATNTSARWKAPEILKDCTKVSSSCDIYSLGCIYFYVLRKGEHFKKGAEAAGWIKSRFCSHWLITEMADDDPLKRPSASNLLSHPIFWTKQKSLNFLLQIGNIIERYDNPKVKTLMNEMEPRYRQVRSKHYLGSTPFYQDWLTLVNMDIELYHQTYPSSSAFKNDSNRLSGFILLIRNLAADYDKLPEDIKKRVGSLPGNFFCYWNTLYPSLVPMLWLVFQKLVNDPSQQLLKEYYETCAFEFQVNPL